MWHKPDSQRFQKISEGLRNFMGEPDHRLIWLNATKQDQRNPDRYQSWRVYDHEVQGVLPSDRWHNVSRLHTGENLTVAQVNDATHGFEHEFYFSTNSWDPTCSLHNARYGMASRTEAVLFEVHLPWIGNLGEEAVHNAFLAGVEIPGIELGTLLGQYQIRREKLRRFNQPRLGQIPPAGLISTAATIKLLHKSDVTRIYMPLTLPIRHSWYKTSESELFHTQALNLFKKAGELIDGMTLNNWPDKYGYIHADLGPRLSSRHKLLESLFS